MVHDMIFYLCGGYGIVDEYLSAICTYDGNTNIFHCNCTYTNKTWCSTAVNIIVVVIVVWSLNKLTYSACIEGLAHFNASELMSSLLNERVYLKG